MTVAPPVPVLHLRQSSGGGGGADSVLRQQLALAAGSERIAPNVAYLHKPGRSIDSLREAIEILGVPFFDVPGRAWIDRAQVARLAALIDETGARILHAHDPKTDVLARWLRRRRPGLKIVTTLHGWTGRSLKGRLYNRIDHWAVRGFDRVVAVSRSVAERAAAGGIRGVRVVPNGIDVDFWKRPGGAPPRRPQAPFTVLFAGRLSFEKTPTDFVRAAAILAGRLPDARFQVVGDGPEREAVSRLARDLGLDGRLEVLGHVRHYDLLRLLGKADAVLLTSRTEGLPMTLLEAAAMEVPAVATRVGGVPEVVADGETGVLVEFGAVEAMAGALAALAADPERAAAMGREARARVVAAFSQEANWRLMEDLYLELAA